MASLEQLLADLTSGDEPRAENAAVQFVSHGEAGFQALISLSKSPDEDNRWWALRAICEFETPEVSTPLIAALQDPEDYVRTCAALGLRYHPDIIAIPELVDQLQSTNQLLEKVAGDALIAIGTPATPALIQLIEDPQAPHRAKLEAVRVLSSTKDTAAIATLFKVSQEGSSLMQYWAEKGLDNMGIGMVFFDPS